MKRSDLICENGVINDKENENFVHNFILHRTECNEFIINNELSEKLGKPVGRYVTMFCNNGDYYDCLKEILTDFIPQGNALVVGLGNERICSDSLGPKSLRYIPATAHLSEHSEFSELGIRKITVIEPSVTGKTGIESAEQVKCIAEKVKADFIIAIDCLACSDTDRLCRMIQITDSGICPGAGVGNSRKELSFATTGIKVIAVGVPTVTDYDCGCDKLMVSPRNIDVIIDGFAKIIGKSISKALNPQLSDNEIESLIIR